MFPIGSEMKEVSLAVGVLSAMITPAILILATGSLLATTSNRLMRVIDRVRELSAEIRNLVQGSALDDLGRSRRELLFVLLRSATTRARMLQRSLTWLSLAIGSFILTSIVIGVLSLTHYDVGWVALLFGFIGSVLLLAASVIMILESRIALTSIRAETAFVQKWGELHLSSDPGAFIASVRTDEPR